MSQGPHITQDVLHLIAQIHTEHPDWQRKAVRQGLLDRMKERGIDRNFGPGWPGENAVGRHLKKIRDRSVELAMDLKDRPWSVTALADHDIPPAALPVVMNAWAKSVKDNAPLTIREAKWVARLHCVYGGGTEISLEWLVVRAREYASDEKALKLTGAYPHKPQMMRGLWFRDFILYVDGLDRTSDEAVARARHLGNMYGIDYQVTRDDPKRRGTVKRQKAARQ